MNPKALYAAGGGIAAAAIAIFFIMGPGNLRLPGGETAAPVQPADLQVALREINVEQTDAQNADVQVVFTAYNPNSATILLETIHYTVLVDDFQMTSDDIGLSPEGFLAGQANTFTVVGNSTVTLRSTQEAVRNNLTASSWDSMVDGTAQYEVEGLYAYRLTGSNFQTNFFEREFSLTFP